MWKQQNKGKDMHKGVEEKLLSFSHLWTEVRTQLITARIEWLLKDTPLLQLHFANEGWTEDVNSGDSELRLSLLQQSIHLDSVGESIRSTLK